MFLTDVYDPLRTDCTSSVRRDQNLRKDGSKENALQSSVMSSTLKIRDQMEGVDG